LNAGYYRLTGQRLRGEVERRGRVGEGWNEKVCLFKDDAHNRDKLRSSTTANRLTLPQCGNEGVILYELRSRDVKR